MLLPRSIIMMLLSCSMCRIGRFSMRGDPLDFPFNTEETLQEAFVSVVPCCSKQGA